MVLKNGDEISNDEPSWCEIDDYVLKLEKLKGEVIKEIQVGYDSETGKPVMEKKALDLNIFPKLLLLLMS